MIVDQENIKIMNQSEIEASALIEMKNRRNGSAPGSATMNKQQASPSSDKQVETLEQLQCLATSSLNNTVEMQEQEDNFEYFIDDTQFLAGRHTANKQLTPLMTS